MSLLKPTSRKGEFYENWNKKVNSKILRYRVDDEKFKELRDIRKIYICEKPHQKDDIEFTPTGKKTRCITFTAPTLEKSRDAPNFTQATKRKEFKS